jgi:hypothetical protein
LSFAAQGRGSYAGSSGLWEISYSDLFQFEKLFLKFREWRQIARDQNLPSNGGKELGTCGPVTLRFVTPTTLYFGDVPFDGPDADAVHQILTEGATNLKLLAEKKLVKDVKTISKLDQRALAQDATAKQQSAAVQKKIDEALR